MFGTVPTNVLKTISMPGWVYHNNERVKSNKGPCGILAPYLCTLYEFFFLVKQLSVGKNCTNSICEHIKCTILGRYIMVAVPVKVLVCVGRVSAN